MPQSFFGFPLIEKHETSTNVQVCVEQIISDVAHGGLFGKEWVGVEDLSVIPASESRQVRFGCS